MNYRRIYENLVSRGKSRKPDFYYEKHHIIPRCLGGSDDKSNLVDLTPEEHYLAHQLLVKIYPNNHKLAMAAAMMIPQRRSNKMYGWLKKRHSIAMSKYQSGSENSQFGTRWIHNIESEKSKKIDKNDPLPEGWDEGRKINFDQNVAECEYCKKEYIKLRNNKFCSDKCKLYYRSPQYKIIDDNIEEILKDIEKNGSVSGALRRIGVVGERIGNKYVSDIAKSKGIKILRRRNTADIV